VEQSKGHLKVKVLGRQWKNR